MSTIFVFLLSELQRIIAVAAYCVGRAKAAHASASLSARVIHPVGLVRRLQALDCINMHRASGKESDNLAATRRAVLIDSLHRVLTTHVRAFVRALSLLGCWGR